MNSSYVSETQFIDLPGGRLAYDVRDPEGGPLVVCAPGMGDVRAAYRFMVQSLADAGHRVVLLGPFARQSEPSAMVRLALAAVTSNAAIWSRLYYPTMYKAPKPTDFVAYVRALQANLREPGRMAATRGAMTRQGECFARAAEIKCPVLVVMGSRDPDFLDPAADAAYAQELFGANAQTTRTQTVLAMIDGAAQYPLAELPTVTAGAVIPFLNRAIRAERG